LWFIQQVLVYTYSGDTILYLLLLTQIMFIGVIYRRRTGGVLFWTMWEVQCVSDGTVRS